jgi:adenylate cyclase class 2
MKNVELKAKLRDFAAAQAVCKALQAAPRGEIHQVDVYFRVPDGRLKLRTNTPGRAELVFYRRADRAAARASDYTVEPVSETLAHLLRDALAPLVVVEKVRTLYLWKNVRIHLDRVQGLGEFIEFEAVLSDDCDEAEGHRRVATLREAFALLPSDLVPQSYSDLLSNPT